MNRLLLTTVAMCTGCSFGMPTVAKTWTPTSAPMCDPNSIKPQVDTVVGGIAATAAVAILANRCREDIGCALLKVFMGVPLAALSVPYLAGAAYGIKRLNECDRANARYTKWLRNRHIKRRPKPRNEGDRHGRCYPNNTCNAGSVCVSSRCVRGIKTGALDGTCYANATCDAGLRCKNKRCTPIDD